MRLRSGLGGKISVNSNIAAVQLNVARNVAVAPLHHLSVRGLRTQFPSYTGAVRLMSVWAAQHCFSGIVRLHFILPCTLKRCVLSTFLLRRL